MRFLAAGKCIHCSGGVGPARREIRINPRQSWLVGMLESSPGSMKFPPSFHFLSRFFTSTQEGCFGLFPLALINNNNNRAKTFLSPALHCLTPPFRPVAPCSPGPSIRQRRTPAAGRAPAAGRGRESAAPTISSRIWRT